MNLLPFKIHYQNNYDIEVLVNGIQARIQGDAGGAGGAGGAWAPVKFSRFFISKH